MKILVIFLASVLVSAEDPSERIIDGQDVPPGKYPFYAFLRRIGDDGLFRCGSSIITNSWVLSAAHCSSGPPTDKLWVLAGFLDSTLLSYRQRSQVSRKFVHPGYRNDILLNDIVMLQLKTPFYFDALIGPIALPDDRRDKAADWTKCDVMGFGLTFTNNETNPMVPNQYQVLQWAQVLVVPQSECTKWYGDVIEKSHICANDPNSRQGTCTGDSGGPLACYDDNRGEHVLRGAASFVVKSRGCGSRDYPDGFTRISSHLEWIRETRDFGAWQIGSCSVTCGEGTRRDTRKCVAGDCEGSNQLLNRVSICQMPPCANAQDVCKELFCPPNSECIRRKRPTGLIPYFDCDCLPEFYMDNRTGDCLFKLDDINFSEANETSYSEWKIGVCRGACGYGRRTDTRTCVSGDCKDNLVRRVDCRLPKHCTGNLACDLESIFCSEFARCVQHSGEKYPACECFRGYDGDGRACSPSSTSRIEINKLLFISMIVWIFIIQE